VDFFACKILLQPSGFDRLQLDWCQEEMDKLNISQSPENAYPKGSFETELSCAFAALKAGNLNAANDDAQLVLSRAEAGENFATQANALLCLGNIDRLRSRYRSSQVLSQRSAFLFRLLGDVCGESAALNILSHVSSNLGQTEEAIEAALLSVRLADSLPPGHQLAVANNYLGVAYLWGRNWVQASAALDAALVAATIGTPPVGQFQLLSNKFWIEAHRYVVERFDGRKCEGDESFAALATCFDAVASSESEELLIDGAQGIITGIWGFAESIFYSWAGNLVLAEGKLEVAQKRLVLVGKPSWINAFSEWSKVELNWASGDLLLAEASALKMVELCSAIEYEQLACLGHLLASQLKELQGKPLDALEELRRLRRREQSIRTESIQSRERAVQLQLDMRKSEASLQNLEIASKKLERLSLEDGLTGIANRRSFERVVTLLLSDAIEVVPAVGIALIDVDKFKQVNDCHSHKVGNKVLKEISSIITKCIREQDVAARLAGDEFVIAFRQTALPAAIQVCERVSLAIT